jgi:hypothetical protein
VSIAQAFASDGACTIAASTVSASVALPAGTGTTLVLINPTTSVAFFSVGNGSATATASSPYVVPPNGRAIVEIGPNPTAVASLLLAGTGAVYVLRGNGVQY